MLILTDQNGNQYSLTVNATDGSLSVTPTSGSTPSSTAGSPGFTGQDLINRAARAAHVLASGESLQGSDLQDALVIANGMLDTFNSQRLMIYTLSIQKFNLTSGKQTYQIGNGAPDFSVPRPARIEYFSVITLTNPLQPLELPLDSLTDQQWQAIPVKAIQGALPTQIYDDGSFPYRSLSLWPIPNVTTLQLAIYSWQALGQLTLATKYSFPPAYYEAFVYNLAMRIALEWPGQMTPELAAAAAATIKSIKTMNTTIVDIQCDPALSNPSMAAYNWRSDQPVNT